MHLKAKQKNYDPNSFEYAWLGAGPEVRQNFVEMAAALADTVGEKEMWFLLWMAGQDADTRASFMAVVACGLRPNKAGG